MKIRTQLILAFLLLAVVPMTVIVLHDYSSSLAAVREAVEAESEALAEDMELRMASVGEEIERRVARVGELPFYRLADSEGTAPERRALMDDLVTELGETAPWVQSVEFVPEVAPAAAVAPSAPVAGVAPAAPSAGAGASDSAFSFEMAPMVVEMEDVFEVVGESLADTPALMKRVEAGLESLPENVDREELREVARAGLRAVAIMAEKVQHDIRDRRVLRDREAAEMEDARRELEDLERVRAEEEAMAEAAWRIIHQPFVREFDVPIREAGVPVGRVRAKVHGERLLRRVLRQTRHQQGEIPFALDEEGNLYALDEAQEAVLRSIPVQGVEGVEGGDGAEDSGQWVVVMDDDPELGLRFGIARPIRESLQRVRATAIRNFAFGSGLIGLALLGILPLSRRITRDLGAVTEGAGRISKGDLNVRVPVRSRNEIGRMAEAFNRMAGDLQSNQEQLLKESQLRRDQEVEQSLLQADLDRKSRELEEARRFQLSLLPKRLPSHESFEVGVLMETATEVGGDYYDFRFAPDGTLTAAIGDATGHGARAGTMVTVVKSLFSAFPPEESLTEFLSQAAGAVRRMDLGRMAMALALARLRDGRLTLASAGMPPPLLFRAASGAVEEIALEGMPLGGLEYAYREVELGVESGDTLLMMSDGFPELANAAGDPLGYARVRDLFAEAARENGPQALIDGLAATARQWSGAETPSDDVTFVALRVR